MVPSVVAETGPEFSSCVDDPSHLACKHEGRFGVAVADSSCHVLIAEVQLEVGDLVLCQEDGLALAGTYSITVPLRSAKNERGVLRLPLRADLSCYLGKGGELLGVGRSPQWPDAPRAIRCEVLPAGEAAADGQLRLTIDTGERILRFTTQYAVRGTPPTPPLAVRSETAADSSRGSPTAGDES